MLSLTQPSIVFNAWINIKKTHVFHIIWWIILDKRWFKMMQSSGPFPNNHFLHFFSYPTTFLFILPFLVIKLLPYFLLRLSFFRRHCASKSRLFQINLEGNWSRHILKKIELLSMQISRVKVGKQNGKSDQKAMSPPPFSRNFLFKDL